MLSSSSGSSSGGIFSTFSVLCFLSDWREPRPIIWSTLLGQKLKWALYFYSFFVSCWYITTFLSYNINLNSLWISAGFQLVSVSIHIKPTIKSNLVCRLLILPSMSRCPAEYCSITSFTSYGRNVSLNFRLATRNLRILHPCNTHIYTHIINNLGKKLHHTNRAATQVSLLSKNALKFPPSTTFPIMLQHPFKSSSG